MLNTMWNTRQWLPVLAACVVMGTGCGVLDDSPMSVGSGPSDEHHPPDHAQNDKEKDKEDKPDGNGHDYHYDKYTCYTDSYSGMTMCRDKYDKKYVCEYDEKYDKHICYEDHDDYWKCHYDHSKGYKACYDRRHDQKYICHYEPKSHREVCYEDNEQFSCYYDSRKHEEFCSDGAPSHDRRCYYDPHTRKRWCFDNQAYDCHYDAKSGKKICYEKDQYSCYYNDKRGYEKCYRDDKYECYYDKRTGYKFCKKPMKKLGCVRTPGFWKNHNQFATAPGLQYVWPIDEETLLCGMTWLDILNTAPRGDAWYILARHYIAARLNVASGAYAPSKVRSAMAAAATLLADNCGGFPPGEEGREEALRLKEILEAFNEGHLGVPSCD